MHEHDQVEGEGYERRDFVGRRGVVIFVGTLGLSVILVGIFCYFFVGYLERTVGPTEEPSPLAGQDLPDAPAPHLQPKPSLEMSALHQRNDQEMTSYEWMDKKTGMVRIPIDRAIEIVAGQNLPAREGKPDAH